MAGIGRKRAQWSGAILALLLLALLIVWTQRKPIAREAIDSWLEEKGVPADYTVTAIGTRRQRLENVRLGPAERPDLEADWVEIDVSPALSGIGVRAVRAGGVVLRGQYKDGALSFGAVERLLPKPTGEPFRLPDIDLALAGARIEVETPWGPASGRIAGKGNLAGGFAGRMSASAEALEFGDYRAAGVAIRDGAISTSNRTIAVRTPLRIGRIEGGGLRLLDAGLGIDAAIAESLDSWQGNLALKSGDARVAGASARRLEGRASFEGSLARTQGDAQLGLAGVSAEGVTAVRADIAGRYAFALKGLRSAELTGSATATGVRTGGQLARSIRTLEGAGGGTPAAPVAQALARALRDLDRGSEATARLLVRHDRGAGRADLIAPSLSARSGARLVSRPDSRVTLAWPGQAVRVDARFVLSGGGFPQARIELQGSGGDYAGIVRAAPFAAGGSRLALAPVRFRFGRAFGIDTVATLSGPLGNGRIEGLRVPLKLGGTGLAQGCFPAGFERLTLGAFDFRPARLNACVERGSVRVARPRLGGRLGQSPLDLSGDWARFGLARGDFEVAGLNARLTGAAPSSLAVARLSGSAAARGATGGYSGASGQIGAVPLLLSEGTGRWRLQGSDLWVDGAARVADRQVPGRFQQMALRNIALTLANGVVRATAMVHEPLSGSVVSTVALDHNLGSGTGQAVLDVNALRFGRTLQPEMLTPITLGVIANVRGEMNGRGTIQWDRAGVRSSGGFRTERMDFAAAFGPVTGLKGEIALSDLLGLQTGPGQRVTIGVINPGIAVVDGEIAYQLLPGQKLKIEGGRWPFAGGTLVLEPAVLDLSEEAVRSLSFRVEGLDAARFIAQLEFENIAATGIFDGVLPMVFDKTGGRIEGGRLVARAGGGTLSYVGEISNEKLGPMGRFAFDALKSMKYDSLQIDLGGPLDGDVVTQIRFRGVNQAPIEGVRAGLPIPVKITGIHNFPFIFNVTITAPFRRLFDMSRSISDPSLLLGRTLPGLTKDEQKPVKPVQPKESEKVP